MDANTNNPTRRRWKWLALIAFGLALAALAFLAFFILYVVIVTRISYPY